MEWRYWRHGQWHEYDANSSRLLEAAYAAGSTSVPLSVPIPPTPPTPNSTQPSGSSSSAIAATASRKYIVSLQDPGAFTQVSLVSGYTRPVRRALAPDFRRALEPDLQVGSRVKHRMTKLVKMDSEVTRPTLQATPLEPLAAAALRTNEAVMLRGGTYSLRTELQLGKGANLTIRGPGKIVGDAHTLFKVAGNRALLDIAGVRLEHVGSVDRRERRELGAAVFVLGRNQIRGEFV